MAWAMQPRGHDPTVGIDVGAADGALVGDAEGDAVGLVEGASVDLVGEADGLNDGSIVGLADGSSVGQTQTQPSIVSAGGLLPQTEACATT